MRPATTLSRSRPTAEWRISALPWNEQSFNRPLMKRPSFTVRVIWRLTALGMLACIAGPAPAQVWKPAKGIEIVVPTTPGGSVDLSGRFLQKILQDSGLVKVTVTVINKPGGGGALSLVYLNQHAGDAHYLAVNTPNIVANDLNGRSAIRYTDVTPLATLADQYTAVAVRVDSPLRTGRDFVDRLRKDPASLAVSTPTTLGSTNHLSFA